jgi:type III secretory pathway component EscU
MLFPPPHSTRANRSLMAGHAEQLLPDNISVQSLPFDFASRRSGQSLSSSRLTALVRAISQELIVQIVQKGNIGVGSIIDVSRLA